MRYSPILLLVFPMLATALSFEERVDLGYQYSEVKVGRDYDNSIGFFIGKVMRKCMPANAKVMGQHNDFTLVTWVDRMGTVVDPDVQPKHLLSNCFLHEFSTQTLPYPPQSNMTDKGYPLTIYMKVTE